MFPRQTKTADQHPLLLREAIGDDAPEILPFLDVIASETTYISFQPGEFSLTEEQEREFLDKALHADNQLYLLAILDNKIVGCITFSGGKYERTKHTGFFGLSVLKTHWSNGIGSTLLDALLEWARANEVIQKIDLYVRTDNQRAIDLYQRKGFTIEGTKKLDLIVDGHPHDSHLMGINVQS